MRSFGIAVSVLVAPPLYVQPAGEAIGELAYRMANFSRGFAEGLRRPGWSREAADHWLREARALRTDVLRVDQAVGQAEESAGLHPRARSARRAWPRLRSTLTGLERAHITLRTTARAVLDRTYYMPEARQQDAYTTRQRAALADALTIAAAAIDAVAPIAGADDPQQARAQVHALLADLDEQQQLLNSLLAVRPEQDEAAWKQHGALLSSIDRLSVEIATAASEPGWRPTSTSSERAANDLPPAPHCLSPRQRQHRCRPRHRRRGRRIRLQHPGRPAAGRGDADAGEGVAAAATRSPSSPIRCRRAHTVAALTTWALPGQDRDAVLMLRH